MKKFFALLLCFTLFITFDVKALGLLPAIITSNDNLESQAIEFLEGEYALPEFCSTKGCTIEFDIDSLKALGQYKFDSREEYIHLIEGNGVTIYEKGGSMPTDPSTYENNFNKIVIASSALSQNSNITIKMGNLDEERTIKLISPNVSIIEEPSIINDNPNIVITGSDIDNKPPFIEIPTITDIEKPKENVEMDNSEKISNESMFIYILIGGGFLIIISAILLLSIKKPK